MMEMKELVEKLNKARESYYNEGREVMSNIEYDVLYDTLVRMEKETGIILSDSPTQNVGYDVDTSSKLKKVEHKTPALSLDKTKSIDDLKKWLDNKEGVLSWKMDGLTGVVTYKGGKLVSLITRGNGFIGEDITHNARFIEGLPLTIPYKGEIEVRGELVMTYSEFDRINKTLEEPYKNPRNLAAGTMRALDNTIQNRKIIFYAFQMVRVGDEDDEHQDITNLKNLKTFGLRLSYMQDELKINTVKYVMVTKNNLEDTILNEFESKIKDNDYPTDGLVLEYDDIAYGESLGSTGHHPRYGIAFKWKDEEVETVLRKIEWSASRTGLLNPVAIFDSIEIEGTTVSRASLHNISYIQDMDLRIGDKIMVYKANMIIPQVSKNLETRNGENRELYNYAIPDKCPCCGGSTKIKKNNGNNVTLTLYCSNPSCSAKKIGALSHFCERDCMNLEGLSDKIIEELVQNGIVSSYRDFYHLNEHPEIAKLEGYGEKSWKNMIDSAEASRTTDFVHFIHSMGIPNVGKGQAKLLKKHLDNIYDKYEFENDGSYDLMGFLKALVYTYNYDFTNVDGFGEVIHNSLTKWVKDNLITPIEDWKSEGNACWDVINVLKELRFTDKKPEKMKENAINGKTFVITGSLITYSNRNELVEKIESLGGKVSSSVSSKTNYLINNDIASTSGKNKKAKELDIPIISEEDFNNMI